MTSAECTVAGAAAAAGLAAAAEEEGLALAMASSRSRAAGCAGAGGEREMGVGIGEGGEQQEGGASDLTGKKILEGSGCRQAGLIPIWGATPLTCDSEAQVGPGICHGGPL